ncbi:MULTISPECIES: DUF1643 domain-containing protein [Capnocytophaga]|uniref:Uncharacterized protein n=1 Tax=Capnocytophaga canimorsus TaxID=28188 RepID=A0A0B7H9X0_9FLAO|nr:DUF1643 domain-containing protein [Capnocytophaga canimorsus]ATA77696.1 DUF1643 domain-containing protein [Capnocytophaga canimorsus]PJI76033.1 hypothetical protein CLV61_2071 [Capnocytophaga canimorsus]CEN34727.1 conserved hypothetical protein [Capnocytophaga canimorsus]STA72982.1 Uncharacterized protein conserved in bacteria [Capnocytophaga canimorsus]GJQ05655.1 hypothetical protein CAPN009_20700 [Capnocytophaga canimorsus]
MEYAISIYEASSDGKNRFILGTKGKNPLFVIGVNPSTADDKVADKTITKVMGFAEKNNFDSFIMFNLYPQRATRPNDLHIDKDDSLIEENTKTIKSMLQKYSFPTILVAWGNLILERKYLKECFLKIYNELQDNSIRWMKIGNLTNTKNPRHPLYAPYDAPLTEFEIKKYIENFK